MKKIAALFTALPLACGLVVAQTDSQQSSSKETTTTTTTTQTESRPATSTSTTTRTTTDTHSLPAITHWKGILVDANCASGARSTASSTITSTTDQSGSANRTSVTNQGGTTPDQSGITTGTQNPPATVTSSDQTASTQTTTVDSGRHHKGHRNRDVSTQSCPVSSSTTMFALKTQDGLVLRFDSVGNARAAAELKNKPKWSKDLADGKPIRATVDGMMSGETVTVTDVH